MVNQYTKISTSNICFIAIFLGALLIILRSSLYQFILDTVLTLTPGNILFSIWSRKSYVKLDVYMFNWTNPEDFRNRSTKPIVKEIGPFKFNECIERVNVTLNENGTLSYYRKRSFEFNREESAYDLNFNITIPNPVVVGLANEVKDWNYFIKKIVSYEFTLLFDEKIHITKTVGDFLYNGYEDGLLNVGNKLSFLTKRKKKLSKFAWFYERNGSVTADGFFNVGIGKTHPLGSMLEWNFRNTTEYYQDKCAPIMSSNGDFFPQGEAKKVLDVFCSELCRAIQLDYSGNITFENIEGVKYVFGMNIFDNGTTVPGNECTCGDYCQPYGVFFSAACNDDFPAYSSLPHFAKADKYFSEKVLGLTPDIEKHEGYLAYEPVSGLFLRLSMKTQLNMLIKPIPDIRMFKDVQTVMFPVMWFSEDARIPEELMILVKLLFHVETIFLIVGISMIILGSTIFLVPIYRIHRLKRTRRMDSRSKEEYESLRTQL